MADAAAVSRGGSGLGSSILTSGVAAVVTEAGAGLATARADGAAGADRDDVEVSPWMTRLKSRWAFCATSHPEIRKRHTTRV